MFQADGIQPVEETCEVAAFFRQRVQVKDEFQGPVIALATASGELCLDLAPNRVTFRPQPVQTFAALPFQFLLPSALLFCLCPFLCGLAFLTD